MARPVWTGSVSFGLVNIPVQAHTAVRDHDVHFHRLVKGSGARVRNRMVAEDTGDEVDDDDIELGFEIRKGRYVTFSREELAELRLPSTRAVEITTFVGLDEIDPIYYERTYWLAPDGDGAKGAYALLQRAMQERERVGIGTVVMHNKQYLTAVRPMEHALALSTMRFADEVVPRADVDNVPARLAKTDPKMLAMATQIVDALAAPWKPESYHDTYVEELRQRITAKSRGKTVAPVAEPDERAPVVDLLAALEASLRRDRAAPSSTKATAKATAKTKATAHKASTTRPTGRKAAVKKASERAAPRRKAS